MQWKARILVVMWLLLLGSSGAWSADSTHGATNFVFEPAGQLWHIVGRTMTITTWDGPFDVGSSSRWQLYMTFWKRTESASDAAQLLPNNLRVIHELGTTFYYPKGAELPAMDPAQLGYTKEGFKRADQIAGVFPRLQCGAKDGRCRSYSSSVVTLLPKIQTLFPGGLLATGCQTSNGSRILYIHGKSSQDAYLIMWGPDYITGGNIWDADVAYMPTRLLMRSYASVLSNVAYYSQGGMWEIMEFGSYIYYLSRLPQKAIINSSTTAALCPDIPKLTKAGLTIPKGWTEALRKLGRVNTNVARRQ